MSMRTAACGYIRSEIFASARCRFPTEVHLCTEVSWLERKSKATVGGKAHEKGGAAAVKTTKSHDDNLRKAH